MTYYQPYLRGFYDKSVKLPYELFSFQAFATREDCVEWLRNNGYGNCDYSIEEYHDDDIEDVCIINGGGNLANEAYFSEGLYDLIMGKITAEEFRATYGEEIDYDAPNGIINVGNNTIVTNAE